MDNKNLDNLLAIGDSSIKTLILSDVFVYVVIKGSLHAQDCSAFGLGPEEVKAISKKFPGSGKEVVNGVTVETNVINAINALSQLGYKVASSTGESEITWTLKREI